jgi:hypothetical protein
MTNRQLNKLISKIELLFHFLRCSINNSKIGQKLIMKKFFEFLFHAFFSHRTNVKASLHENLFRIF